MGALQLIIVSGLSGSGKSVALNTLEDIGFYCVDNLPLGMLEDFSRQIDRVATDVPGVAVGIDARNLGGQLDQFRHNLQALAEDGLKYQVLFLKCDNDTLIKRFSETRRKHPLSNPDTSLQEAIDLEQQLLEPIAMEADLLIDTSHANVHQLREMVRQRISNQPHNTLSLLFESFGFKQGIPADVDFVFDARCLPNPYWDEALRPHTGLDQPVVAFLQNQPQVSRMQQQIEAFLSEWIPAFEEDNRSYLSIAIGCTGGRHRSVYLVEQLARHFKQHYQNVVIRHRGLS